MRSTSHCLRVVFAAAGVLGSIRCKAQAVPTATRRLQVKVFAGGSGVYTGLNSGRNIGISAGVDLGIHSLHSVFPSLELRGTLPVDKGQTDNQRNVLVGLKLAQYYGPLHPYADLLYGRGEIRYPSGYDTPDRKFFYIQSTSNVFSPGVGLDLKFTDHLDLKVDAQFQRYSTPVVASGHLLAPSVMLGLSYRVPFERSHRRSRTPTVSSPFRLDN